ncbi:MAG: LysR family transcriptional regulator [Xanthobacteraceae bacterium]
MEWNDRIGRRIKLRDLHVLLATIESGSMARAAQRLSISQPVVSKTIAGLEDSLGTRLLDRTPQGIEPTEYGRALLACGTAVFDDLRRGVQEIEFLADPTRGELNVGGAGPFIEGIIPAAVARIAERHPRITFRVLETDAGTLCRLLRERRIDLAICRPPNAIDKNDFVSECLFEETMVVIAGRESRWSTRRKLYLRDLLGEPWALPEPDNVAASFVADVFLAARLTPPKPRVVSNSVAMRVRLVETGKFLTMVPASMLHFGAERLQVKRLPINLSINSPPTEIISLKNRTPSAVARMFLNELRAFSQMSGIALKAVRESVTVQTQSR